MLVQSTFSSPVQDPLENINATFLSNISLHYIDKFLVSSDLINAEGYCYIQYRYKKLLSASALGHGIRLQF